MCFWRAVYLFNLETFLSCCNYFIVKILVICFKKNQYDFFFPWL